MLVEVGAERRNFSNCSKVSCEMVLVPSKYLVRCLPMSLSRSMSCDLLLRRMIGEREFASVGVTRGRLPFAVEPKYIARRRADRRCPPRRGAVAGHPSAACTALRSCGMTSASYHGFLASHRKFSGEGWTSGMVPGRKSL